SAPAMPSADVAPFGLGLRPLAGPVGRVRNRMLNAVIGRTLFRSVHGDYRAMIERVGTEPHPGGIFGSTVSPYLYLHPTAPSLECAELLEGLYEATATAGSASLAGAST
ncbi:MAG: hypothetical protein QOF26_3132, partial [Baekduia sp.]|nr:hypothetical protein [Baekduia sp.]